jgi:hypothetical protein
MALERYSKQHLGLGLGALHQNPEDEVQSCH